MCEMSKSEKKAWIAITGTMASGKSTVLKYLKQLGYDTYDCDTINFDLQQINQKGYIEIVNTFGINILDENKNIDRKKLASIIFSNELEKQKLEQIMHPLILEKLNEIKNNIQKLTFIEVPLLYELNWQKYFDEDWLVISDKSKLIERCIQNRNMNINQIEERIKTQMSVEEKIKRAKIIINNDSTLENLYKQINELIERR